MSSNVLESGILRLVFSFLGGTAQRKRLIGTSQLWRKEVQQSPHFFLHVFVWGEPPPFQLGPELEEDVEACADRPNPINAQIGHPKLLRAADEAGIVSIVTSAFNVVMLTRSGSVKQWKQNELVELFPGRRALQIAASCPGLDIFDDQDHFALVTEHGQLYTWGSGSSGQLGGGSSIVNLACPTLVQWPEQQGLRVTQVSCGCCFTAFVATFRDSSASTPQAWWFGAMGHADRLSGTLDFDHSICCDIPERLHTDAVREVCCGGYHLGLVTVSGDLLTMGAVGGWSDGNYMGHGSPFIDVRIPTPIEGLRGIVAHAAAGQIMMGCITVYGDVYTWGDGDQGSLGLGLDAFPPHRDSPAYVHHLGCNGILRFSFGNSCALTEDGRLLLWGTDDDKWPCVSGLTSPVPKELRISCGASENRILDCVVGSKHTIALVYEMCKGCPDHQHSAYGLFPGESFRFHMRESCTGRMSQQHV